MAKKKTGGRAVDRGDAGTCITCDCKLCQLLTPEMRTAARRFRTRRRGDRIENETGSCFKFSVITAGTAAICVTLTDGRRQIVGLVSAGDLVCGMSAEYAAQTWLEVLCDSSVCEVDLTSFADRLRSDPEIMCMMFRQVHDQLEASTTHAVALGRLDSMERICLFLVERTQQAASDGSEPIRVVLPMSREDIADYLGMNVETVSRTLSRVKKAGLVNFLSPSEFVVPDLDALVRHVPLSTLPARRFLTAPAV